MESKIKRYTSLIFVCILLLTGGASCSGNNSSANKDKTLFDFEKREELDFLHWECGTFMEPDARHATAGRHSLRVEMYSNAEYPGFKCSLPDGVAGFKKLLVDIYNAQDFSFKISFRIDDREDSPPYADRANGSFMLQPGDNVLTFDLENLTTSKTARNMNLKKVNSFMLFVHKPENTLTLFLDNIRLIH
ncbi:MAG: hypothetical protein KQH63_04205 [Desulfobulbaceae bacterium]|nr:hypothetical protein [Desulfobulbaceae bacterium]